jgi:cysteine desulfurase/selenocysteine lyase
MRIKSDFSIYDSNPDFAYFDSASTTLVPKTAVEATTAFLNSTVASARRGAHSLAVQASTQVEDARNELASLFDTDKSQISFQKSIPTAVASFAYGYYSNKKDRNKIIIAQSEENSVFVALLRVAEVLKLDVVVIPVDAEGLIDTSFMEEVIDEKTGIVATGHVTVGTGTVNPTGEISQIAHEKGALLLTDATRSIGFFEFNPANLGADVVLCSGNVGLMGPPGLEIQWIHKSVGEYHTPGILGGSAVANVEPSSYETAFQPDKFESGILNVPAIIGFRAAVRYIQKLTPQQIVNHLRKLTDYLESRLNEIRDLTIYGPSKKKSIVHGFNIGNESRINCHEVAMFLDDSNIAVRSGLLCAHPLIKPIVDDGLVQVSLHAYNSESDIDRLVESLQTITRELL